MCGFELKSYGKTFRYCLKRNENIKTSISFKQNKIEIENLSRLKSLFEQLSLKIHSRKKRRNLKNYWTKYWMSVLLKILEKSIFRDKMIRRYFSSKTLTLSGDIIKTVKSASNLKIGETFLNILNPILRINKKTEENIYTGGLPQFWNQQHFS